MAHETALMIGGNLGDRKKLIDDTRALLSATGTLKKASSIYETVAWGKLSDKEYLNQALWLETKLSPADLLHAAQTIEKKLGRFRDEKWGDRTMDIDILYYDNLVCKTEELTLPHPLIQERNFVLVPLVEILPDYVHPLLRVSNKELLRRCTDNNRVRLYEDSNTN